MLLISTAQREAVVTVVCPGDAQRSLGMFLYKTLKYRDEEEDVQVHTQLLSDVGQSAASPRCLDVSVL